MVWIEGSAILIPTLSGRLTRDHGDLRYAATFSVMHKRTQVERRRTEHADIPRRTT